MKRLVSVLTVLAMCLSLLPTAVLANCETCVDENHDHYCDVCHEIYWYVEDHICVAEGCNARESYVSGAYTELAYRMDGDEAVADGKVSVYARVLYGMDMESSEPAEGIVAVTWEDAITPVAVLLNEEGEGEVEFTGLPVAFLDRSEVCFTPSEAEAVLPSENGLVAEYDDNLFEMEVSSDFAVTINGVEENELYFPAGDEVTVTVLMNESAEGTLVWSFDEDKTDILPDYEQDGVSISFAMPESDVSLYVSFDCDECADGDEDHWCDTCGGRLSECDDENGDGECECCGEWVYPDADDLNVYAQAGDTEITVFWSPVVYSVGEDTLTHYLVYCCDEESGDTENTVENIVPYVMGADTYTYTFTGLTNDISYEVGVTAQYAWNESGTAAVSVIPCKTGATEPGKPRITGATHTDESITLYWKAPENDGGSRVRHYGIDVISGLHGVICSEINPEPDANGVMSYTVEDLICGESYSVGVYAYNAVDRGEASWIEVALSQSGSGDSGSESAASAEKPVGAEQFTDLDAGAWYYEAVDYVLKNALMAGVGEGTFAPGMITDRAMIVTILWSLAGKPVAEDGRSFTDVEEGKWYTDAIRWAASEGIIAGSGDGTFAPGGELTREQLAAILYSFEKYKGGGFTGTWMFRLNYPDVAEISDWAYESMCWMTMHKVISGKDGGILDPKGAATRAEVAQMLMRYLEG